MKIDPGDRPVWPDAVMELPIDSVRGGCVEFRRGESFEAIAFNKTDWLKLGAPATIKVMIVK